MKHRHADFRDSPFDGDALAIRTKLGQALREQYNLAEPLPQSLVELLAPVMPRAFGKRQVGSHVHRAPGAPRDLAGVFGGAGGGRLVLLSQETESQGRG
jgi:hypothetical protein